MIAVGICIQLRVLHYQIFPVGQHVVLNNGPEATDYCFMNASWTKIMKNSRGLVAR